MSVELKIKSKHLSAEAQIIRFEEKKLLKQAQWAQRASLAKELSEYRSKYLSISAHRKYEVRNENRSTYLARAFLAGTPYKVVEQARKDENEYNFKAKIIPRVKTLISKYGSHNVKEVADTLITEWLAAK